MQTEYKEISFDHYHPVKVLFSKYVSPAVYLTPKKHFLNCQDGYFKCSLACAHVPEHEGGQVQDLHILVPTSRDDDWVGLVR